MKILKPRAIVEMLDLGTRDVGFAGADWVAEDGAELVELVDTGLDRVRLIAAAPESILEDGALPRRAGRRVGVRQHHRAVDRGTRARREPAPVVRRDGSAAARGCRLHRGQHGDGLDPDRQQPPHHRRAHDLVDAAVRLAPGDGGAGKRERIEAFSLLVRSVLEARRRVMLEVNVAPERLNDVVAVLPSMREPTVAALHGSGGYAVKVAVLREDLPRVIPAVKACGGTDLVVTTPEQIVP